MADEVKWGEFRMKKAGARSQSVGAGILGPGSGIRNRVDRHPETVVG